MSSAMGLSPNSGFVTPGSGQVAPLSSIASALAKPGPLWQAGPIAMRPHLNYQVVHGSGILRIPGLAEKTTMHTISPGVLFDLGTRTIVDYTLSRIMYSNRLLTDTTDHNVQVQTGVTYDEWRFGLSGSYGSNSSILVETGAPTRDETYATSGVVSRQLGRRSELEVNLSHSIRSASPIAGGSAWQGTDYTLWAVSTWWRNHISKDLSLAAGVGAGYDEIKDAPDMSHVQPQVQVSWKPTQKISVNAEYGLERRRTRATVARTQENGRYSASVNYSPFPTTTISIGASRSIEPSYFTGQTTESDGWNVGLQQRLLTKLFLSIRASQRNSNYDSAVSGTFPNRDDKYDSFNVRLSMPFLRRASIAVFYQWGRNDSSLTFYQFTTNQVGAEFSYRF